jgi:hypothetical protein
MPQTGTIVVRPQAAPDGSEGWLVASDGTPVGFILGAEIHTPSGARYTAGSGVMRDADGRVVVTLDEDRVSDAVSGVTWELKPGWTALAAGTVDGGLELDVWTAFAKPYTLEDAQGAVPVRVRLMMAREMVRQRRPEVGDGGLD